MSYELSILTITAASIGFFHTLFGPDHYLPFIVMSRARKWSLSKTTLITLLCGIGHIMSSVVLGIIGIVFGIAVTQLEIFESFRGNLAAWAFIAFGLAYFVWGIHKALKKKHHHHHIPTQGKKTVTPWVLFTIFVLGPCEPLIPLLMYPAAKKSLYGLILVIATFGIVTIGTMLGVVLISARSINFIPSGRLEKYVHAIAGLTIFISGMAIQFLGL